MTVETLSQVQAYLEQFTPQPNDSLTFAQKFNRMKHFMKLLGNPQNKLKVIHIAGTSGKGSTTYAISSILHALGFKVGLSVSPHLIDLRERSQINNTLIFEKLFGMYLSEIIPVIEQMKQSKEGAPSYFEITMALAYYIFFKEKVDYAVMETGLGGRYDATNTATSRNKICVITKIGYDHMDLLGNTLSKIAAEKAHIIHPHNLVLSVPQDREAAIVISKVANEKSAHLKYIEVNFDIKTSLHGEYQKENLSIALATVYELSKRDRFPYDGAAVKETLMNLHFPGRFDVVKKLDKMLILDGAHNPQKMEAFIESLKKEYPDRKFDFLISFKKGKNYKEMLKYIVPIAEMIMITHFELQNQGIIGESDKSSEIRDVIKEMGFNKVQIIENTKHAYEKALKNSKDIVVITGSLYLLSEIYPFTSTPHKSS